MKILRSFENFINEQEKDKKDAKPGEINLAQVMFDNAMKSIIDKDFTQIADTEETKGGLPVKSCGSTPYAFKAVDATNQEIMNLFKEPDGKFSKNIRYSDVSKLVTNGEKNIFLVGVREELEIKKKEGDRFTDKMMLIDPSKPNDKVISYQITTSPSVAFYSDPNRALNKSGVAIMMPGVTKYKVGVHRKGSPTEHEALLQSGEMEINRYELNTKEIKTYRPGNKSTGADYGINIHRSSKDRGICVGPYSAGCQVFADGNDFSDFMNRIKAASQNNGVFLYALLENDELGNTGNAPGATGETGATGGTEAGSAETEKKNKKKTGDDDIEEGGDSEDRLRSAAKKIKNELDKWNSDEDLIIKTYNNAVTSSKMATKMREVYDKLYAKDIIDDMDGALSNSELEKLEYS
jgi:hypothetical protein